MYAAVFRMSTGWLNDPVGAPGSFTSVIRSLSLERRPVESPLDPVQKASDPSIAAHRRVDEGRLRKITARHRRIILSEQIPENQIRPLLQRSQARLTLPVGEARPRLRRQEQGTREWRHKPLRSLKTDSQMAPRHRRLGVSLSAFSASGAVSPCTRTEKATTAKAEMRMSSRRGRSAGSASASAKASAPRKPPHHIRCC